QTSCRSHLSPRPQERPVRRPLAHHGHLPRCTMAAPHCFRHHSGGGSRRRFTKEASPAEGPRRTALRNPIAGLFVVRVINDRKERDVSILWIILIVVLVLALFGFIGRGRF